MEKFKRSFSMRKKRDAASESSKPHQWQEDERKVREGSCSFQVKYLGCIEVFESRGIQVCEEAVKALKSVDEKCAMNKIFQRKTRRSWSLVSFRKKRDDSQQSKSNHHRAILYVTGDALRVVDELNKGLIVDQTIEKVSFCAPDRNHEKGFAYICRDGTTRRWMCHGFLAVKESGERLSHAVGCAFAICLEKKQQREKEKVTVTYNENGTSFTRLGSFRQTTLTERLADPQSAILAEPVPVKQVENPFALKRPHAPADIVERQGSFRNFPRLAESSPFKRNISLRVNELPSTLERHRMVFDGIVGPEQQIGTNAGISVIFEAEEQDMSPVSGASRQLSNDFAALNTRTADRSVSPVRHPTAVTSFTASVSQTSAARQMSSSATSMSYQHVTSSSTARVSNPWADGAPPPVASNTSPPIPAETAVNTPGKVSDAEFWLNSTASQIDPFANVPHVGVRQTSTRYRGSSSASGDHMLSPRVVKTGSVHQQTVDAQRGLAAHSQLIQPVRPIGIQPVAPMINSHLVMSPHPQPFGNNNAQHAYSPLVLPVASRLPGPQIVNSQPMSPQVVILKGPQQQQFSNVAANAVQLSAPPPNASSISISSRGGGALDPFESAWAAKTTNRGSSSVANPFQTNMDNVTPAFQVYL